MFAALFRRVCSGAFYWFMITGISYRHIHMHTVQTIKVTISNSHFSVWRY